MGCCLATHKPSSPSSSSLAQSQKLHRRLEDRAPPPSADEPETVKEVLSETANPKLPLPVPEPHTKFHNQLVGIAEIHETKQSSIHVVDKMEIEKLLLSPAVQSTGNSEEASDFRSLSFSERSVATTAALTEKREEEEDEEEVTQRVFRSPAKLPPPTRKPDPMPRIERVVGRSPNRRHDQSPGKRVIQSSERVRREARRPEHGESSGRRSRSPAMNRSVVNRSPSGRRTGKSPGRARVDGSSSKLTRKSNIQDNVTDGGQSESLENPLVSLECFIFL